MANFLLLSGSLAILSGLFLGSADLATVGGAILAATYAET